MNKADYINSWKSERRNRGLCWDCPAPALVGKGRCQNCLKKGSERKALSKERLDAQRIQSGLCIKCGKQPSEIDKTYCRQCLTRETQYQHKAKWKLIEKVIRHYSNQTMQCECCGESIKEFLTIDHPNGGGRQEFLEYGSSKEFYRHLVQAGFPSGYRVLCINCNFGRNRNNGICPHEAQHRGL
jgi:hypothetical protein